MTSLALRVSLASLLSTVMVHAFGIDTGAAAIAIVLILVGVFERLLKLLLRLIPCPYTTITILGAKSDDFVITVPHARAKALRRSLDAVRGLPTVRMRVLAAAVQRMRKLTAACTCAMRRLA